MQHYRRRGSGRLSSGARRRKNHWNGRGCKRSPLRHVYFPYSGAVIIRMKGKEIFEGRGKIRRVSIQLVIFGLLIDRIFPGGMRRAVGARVIIL